MACGMRERSSHAGLAAAKVSSESGSGMRARIAEFRKAREFFPATLANGVGQVRAEIAEKGKRLCCSPFFAHEQHGYLGEEQIGGRDGPQRVCRRDRSQPIAERPIADLIVVLNECDECCRRQAAARLPACVATIRHELALKCEALRE